MKKRILLMCTLLLMVVAVTFGNGFRNIIREKLSGFEEVPALSTPASAEFKATISHDETAIDYELSYEGIATPVTQGHIHLGNKGVNGGVSVFFCTNGTPPAGVPAPQACPPSPATIKGTLTAADVVGPAAQGINPADPNSTRAAEFAELIRAIRAGSTYANVHSMQYPG